MTKKFYVIRHGETDWNKERRLQGAKDLPLNNTGIEQAKASAKALKNIHFDRIISSPLLRAYTTAEIIHQETQKPLHAEEKLKERHFGSAEGQKLDDLLKQANLPTDAPLEHILDATAETLEAVCIRAHKGFMHWVNTHTDETLLFVAHGFILNALNTVLTGEAGEHPQNCTIYSLKQTKKNKWVCEKVNKENENLLFRII